MRNLNRYEITYHYTLKEGKKIHKYVASVLETSEDNALRYFWNNILNYLHFSVALVKKLEIVSVENVDQ